MKELKWVVLGMVCLMLGLSGCGKRPSEEPAAAGTIKIGMAAPLTGDCAQFGEMIKMGARLMVKELNEAGGINGKKIELVEEDDAANPQEAASVAQKLSADKDVLIVIGHFNSSCSLAGKPIYKEAGLVELSPGSTNPNVCKETEWTFRNIYEDTFQGQSLAHYVQEKLNLKRVAVFFDNDDYGIGLKDAFVNEARKIGLEIVDQQAYERDTTDFRPQLTSFKKLNPDTLFISGLYTQGALIAAQSREMGMAVQLLGADGLLSSDYIKNAGQAAEGTILSCPFLFELGGEKTKNFVNSFTAEYKLNPDCWAALTYDAVGIAALAIKEAGEDRTKIRDYLSKITSPEKGYAGITGLTYFDQNGDCKKPIHVAVVKNGQFVPAEKQIM